MSAEDTEKILRRKQIELAISCGSPPEVLRLLFPKEALDEAGVNPVDARPPAEQKTREPQKPLEQWARDKIYAPPPIPVQAPRLNDESPEAYARRKMHLPKKDSEQH